MNPEECSSGQKSKVKCVPGIFEVYNAYTSMAVVFNRESEKNRRIF